MEYEPAFLVEQYSQCNEHLRESNRKRDLLFGLYITLSLAYFSIFKESNPDKNSIFVIVGLSFLGSCLGIVFTLFRGWHGFYVITAIILQKISVDKKVLVDNDFIKNINYKFNNTTSLELFVFGMLNILTFFNTLFSVQILLANKYILVAILISVFWFIQLLLHFIVMIHFDHLKNNSGLTTEYLWLLQGIIDK